MKNINVMLIATIFFSSLLQSDVIYAENISFDADNNLYDMCQKQYKKCSTRILDKVDAFYKIYEVNENNNVENECTENIHEITNAEYEYVSCQDELNRCRNNSDSTQQRIHHTKDLSLMVGDLEEKGLSK